MYLAKCIPFETFFALHTCFHQLFLYFIFNKFLGLRNGMPSQQKEALLTSALHFQSRFQNCQNLCFYPVQMSRAVLTALEP